MPQRHNANFNLNKACKLKSQIWKSCTAAYKTKLMRCIYRKHQTRKLIFTLKTTNPHYNAGNCTCSLKYKKIKDDVRNASINNLCSIRQLPPFRTNSIAVLQRRLEISVHTVFVEHIFVLFFFFTKNRIQRINNSETGTHSISYKCKLHQRSVMYIF